MKETICYWRPGLALLRDLADRLEAADPCHGSPLWAELLAMCATIDDARADAITAHGYLPLEIMPGDERYYPLRRFASATEVRDLGITDWVDSGWRDNFEQRLEKLEEKCGK